MKYTQLHITCYIYDTYNIILYNIVTIYIYNIYVYIYNMQYTHTITYYMLYI